MNLGVKGKKWLAVIAGILVVSIFVLAVFHRSRLEPDVNNPHVGKSAPLTNEKTDPATPSQLNNDAVTVKQNQPAEKALSESAHQKGNEEQGSDAEIKFAKNLVANYVSEKNLSISEADQVALAEKLIQLRLLTIKARNNLENEHALYSPEDQTKFITQLMQGDTAFSAILGITLSEFVETLPDEQVTKLFAEELK